MSFDAWVGAVGLLLLTMALSSAWIQRVPVSSAALYLGVGCLIGPWGLDLIRLEIGANTPGFEHLTEIAVVLSLFVGGLRLRLPTHHSTASTTWPTRLIKLPGKIKFLSSAPCCCQLWRSLLWFTGSPRSH